jgi:hypothetical protein
MPFCQKNIFNTPKTKQLEIYFILKKELHLHMFLSKIIIE